jgi:hypothetical protein
MPTLIVIIDECAELADEAPSAMADTDSIARLSLNPPADSGSLFLRPGSCRGGFPG